MQRYIVLINFTDKGMKSIKNLPKRIQAAHRRIDKTGGKIIDWNLTMGKYDSIAIIELPDDHTVAGTLLGARNVPVDIDRLVSHVINEEIFL